MRIDLFGRIIEAQKTPDGWQVFHVGGEGKKRLAPEIVIPSTIAEDAVLKYLDDLYHEMATSQRPRVRRLD